MVYLVTYKNTMRNIFFGAVLTLLIVFGFRYCEFKKDTNEQLVESTGLIQKQIKNVGKLIVTEGSYAQVLTYEDSKKIFSLDILDAKKKALVVVNAKATISYDLSQIKTEVDESTKTVRILHIPEPELSVNPNIEYYDVKQDYLNMFGAEDYNKIKDRVAKSLDEKIRASALYSNAQNRLISELQKIYILTNSLGWTLTYENTIISSQETLENIPLKK